MAVLKLLKKRATTRITLMQPTVEHNATCPAPPADGVALLAVESGALGETPCEPDDGWFSITPANIAELQRLLAAESLQELVLDEEGKIGYTFKCAAAAAVAAGKAAAGKLACGEEGLPEYSGPGQFKAAVMAIVAEAGDADTNATVAGALLGCELGYAQLPRDWLAGLRHLQPLWAEADQLCNLLGLLSDPEPAPAMLVPRRAMTSTV